MKRSRWVVLGAVLPLVVGVAVATADPGSDSGDATGKSTAGTECTFKNVTVVFLPGLSTEPGVSSFYSTRPATITCNGPVDGANPTGPGTARGVGRIGTEEPVTCTSGGKAWGVQQFEIPTDAGTKVIRNAITITFGAGAFGSKPGAIGEYKGDYADGVVILESIDQGDCVTAPMTEATFGSTLVFHEFRAPEGG